MASGDAGEILRRIEDLARLVRDMDRRLKRIEDDVASIKRNTR